MDNRLHPSETRVTLAAGRVRPAHAGGQNNPTQAACLLAAALQQYFKIPYGGSRQLVPHISREGGVTRRADGSAFPCCVDYAATRSEVPEKQWCSLGFTYDGAYIRAYLNGVMEARPLDPVKDKRTDRYVTQEGPGGGSDFTVGARYAVGSMLKEATIGEFGGLAVFHPALTDAEMKQLHDAANLKALNK